MMNQQRIERRNQIATNGAENIKAKRWICCEMKRAITHQNAFSVQQSNVTAPNNVFMKIARRIVGQKFQQKVDAEQKMFYRKTSQVGQFLVFLLWRIKGSERWLNVNYVTCNNFNYRSIIDDRRTYNYYSLKMDIGAL